ncbi:probable NADH-ubiquinone oxidoreductase-related protein [alpha proteobacterium BAL199]|jgi:hypothetical protein|nr:probable NADH-ubiquinone oxidoreductase-related protein [alpha proteobacterium BAL199]
MQVRIYKPAKNAMQSGRAKTKHWVLEYRAETARIPEPLMGWVSSGDTTNQVRIPFDTREEAVTFAKRHGFAYSVVEPHERAPRPKAYADNFAFNRKINWTH